MNQTKLLSLLFLLFTLSSHANADGQSAQEIMAVSKIAGACGILDSMLHFQKTTKMPGGEEFTVRFWATEAARLGLTMQQYSDQCNGAITSYDKFWKALESSE